MSKIAAFIDGPNLYAASKRAALEIDYKRLLTWLEQGGQLVTTRYYTALLEEQDDTFVAIRPMLDWLSYNGYVVCTKPAKTFTDSNGRQKTKGNMDIEIAVDMLDLADRVDQIVFFTGDGDFRRLVEAVQRKGVRVTVVSSNVAPNPLVADELRRQADEFIDLSDIRIWIERTQKPAEGTVRVQPVTLQRKIA